MDSLKDALQYVADMARKNEKTEVLEICGHTYGNKELGVMMWNGRQSR